MRLKFKSKGPGILLLSRRHLPFSIYPKPAFHSFRISSPSVAFVCLLFADWSFHLLTKPCSPWRITTTERMGDYNANANRNREREREREIKRGKTNLFSILACGVLNARMMMLNVDRPMQTLTVVFNTAVVVVGLGNVQYHHCTTDNCTTAWPRARLKKTPGPFVQNSDTLSYVMDSTTQFVLPVPLCFPEQSRTATYLFLILSSVRF